MILLAHLLFGAAIGNLVKNPVLAIILALLSHYLLDLIPHTEYPIENIVKKQWSKATPDILRVILDFSLGILLIFIFSKNNPIIYFCAFFAILPDGITVVSFFLPNKISDMHNWFHRKKIHFLKYKKIPIFWRIFSQFAIIVISVFMLRY